MAARSFEQILAEVTAQSDPQKKIVLDQISGLPTQQAADEASLDAKRSLANEDIINAARRRGTGIALGGIPLGEQNKYAQTDYAPALANMKTSYNNQRGTLESALAGIGQNNYMSAQDIFGRDQAAAQQQSQFEASLAFQREQLAAQQRAAAAARATPTFGLPSQGGSVVPTDPVQQSAYNEVHDRFAAQDDNALFSDYLATLKSANYGNARDKFKIAVYNQYRPDFVTRAQQPAAKPAAPAPQKPAPTPLQRLSTPIALPNGGRLF